MKNTSMFRRVLSVVLSVAMLFSLLVPAVSAEQSKAQTVEELTLEPMDPGALDSHKLGETKSDESIAKEDHALTDVVRVSIVLEKASTLDAGFKAENIANNAAAKAYRQSLRADQNAVTAKIEKAIGGKLDVKWNLTLAANNISANVLYGQIDTIKAVEGVKDVFLENRYEPQTDESVDEPNNGAASYMIGSNITWANGYTGAGSKVAVIDTGIDSEHQSFSGEALEYALRQNAEAKGMSYEEYVESINLLTAEKIDAVKDQLNANIGSGAAAYRSTKIAYGYNYVDKRVDYIEHMQDSQGEHGSHVEGISAANRFIKVDGEFVPALQAVGTQGVAPDAQIVTMKVFGIGGGAYDSDYMVAIEDAIILGCDSANLSLGSGAAGFSFSSGYEATMNKLVENGTVVAMSAGNSYGWYDTPYDTAMYPYLYADDVNYATGGSPGSFTNSLTVASVDNLGQTGMPLLFGDMHVFYSETSGYGNDPIATIAGKEYEYVLVDGPGVDDNEHVGAEGDQFMALGSEVLTGKIAMCYRGSSSFFAKANAAVAQGAVGVIIINNTDGVINMNLTGYNYHAPAVSILKADGDAIMANSEKITTEGGQEYYTGTMSIAKELEIQVPEVTDTVTVSSFSSWGTPGTLVLKPEILAPGGSIYSVFGANNGSTPQTAHDQYEVMSGTSMASPQVAGMAAVMGQYIRDNKLTEKTGLTQRQLINSLLMSTAHPVFDADGNYWPVIRVGAGLGNVGDATAAQSYILMDEDATMFPASAKDGKVKVELGDDPDMTGEYDFSFTVYPMEGKKEFTLRTDIFTQWLAGNGGYGMLQDQGTVLLGSEATYEVNGKTYEDTYTLEADVNMDGETDAADAQAILDHITGKEAEDAKFDETVADVDGDGKITSFDAKQLLDAASTPTIEITEPTKVKVHVKIDEGDIAYLLNYFTKGFYVQGYTYVEPVADEEGAMDVVHSIPIFGFFGNWTDPSMLDRSSAIDAAYGTGKRPYLANSNTNYLTMKDAEGNTLVYMGNPYMIEDKFPADRLAMNSNATIQAYNFMPIRNVGTVGFAIMSEDGEVLFASATPGQRLAAYYYVNGGTWQNTSPANYNVAKKLSAAGVKEGEKYTVAFYALPEYYSVLNAELKGEVATSGGIDTEGLKNVLEAGLVGEGAAIAYNVTIDDTAPVVKGAFRDLITGDITVMASDDNYIAYVGVLNKSGSKEFMGVVPEQTEPGQQVEVPLDLEGQKLPNEVTLLVGDYAGNEAAFKVSLGGSEEDVEPIMLGFVPAGSTAAPGTGNRVWEIDRENVSYDYSAGTYTGLSVYSSVPAAVTAAEYVDGYIFMAADDGWFYAGDVNGLDEASRVGRYAEKTAKVYDMAFSYKDNTMYVLGLENVIYTMDLITGKLTPAIKLTLPGTSGIFAEANTLAIDDKGVFYVANYGSTSSTVLFTFEYEAPEPEEEEPVVEDNAIARFDFEASNALEGWTILDVNGDNSTFTLNTTANYAHGGSVSLANRYNSTQSVDDWAITPAIDLNGLETAKLSFYAANRANSFAETMAVAIGTTPNPDEMTVIIPATTLGASVDSYANLTADLADYIGEEPVYIGFHHFDSIDTFYLHIDDVEIQGEYPASDEPEPEPEPEPDPEPLAVEAQRVGNMGVYNYSNGGALAWDHDTDTLYMVSNYSKTQDYDHYLWTVNTETGRAAKANSSNGSYSARLYGNVCGLVIVPGTSHMFGPTEEPTDLIVMPEEMNLLKGQTATASAAVLPWTLTEKEVTWESADETIATVKDGVVTGVEVGETTITVTTVAEPALSKEIAVTVSPIPEAEIRGIIWDADGKGQASVFNTTEPEAWEALSVVGQLRWGTLVDDVVYGSTDDTMYAFDADTYEVSQLGGIVSMWIPSDAIAIPADLVEAWGITGRVGGLCNNGTYFEVLDPEAGNLNYWNLSSAYGSDPMAVIATIGRGDYTDSYGDAHPNSMLNYMITESGVVWLFVLDQEGYLIREELGRVGFSLEGVSDPTNNVWASMVYDAASEFLFVTLYDGSAEVAKLIAIDSNDFDCCAEAGDFNADVWPVVGLYQYEPATDLALKVSPTEIELFETQTAELNIKVKMGETNEYTVEAADPAIASFEDGVVTGLKAGETDLVVTTVDANSEGEQLTETVHVTVKPLTALNVTVKGQVTDAKGARFTSILLDGPTAGARGPEAPFDVYSGTRFGSHYLAGAAAEYKVLSAEDFTEESLNMGFAQYSTYPPTDLANYPSFVNEDGEFEENYVLFPVTEGYLVTPDLYGWNLSSYVSDMAGFAFAGLDEAEDGSTLYVYYMLTASGVLYEIVINPATGTITNFQALMETGITVADQHNLSMAFVYGVDVSYSEDTESYGLVVANNEDKTMWFIDFQTGEIGMIGTLDAENVSGLVGYFDEIETTADEIPVDPFDEAEVLKAFDFEADPTDWTFVDKDGDGYTWAWNHNISSWYSADGQPDYDTMAYEGTGSILSASFINTVGELTPDNWAVSPAIDLSEADEGTYFSFFAKGVDSNYAAEHFAIYAGTSPNPDEMTQISEEFVLTGSWKRYYADLSDFAGESEVYVAIRHFNVSDMFIMDLDKAEILTGVNMGDDSGAIAQPIDVTARAFTAEKLAKLGDGMAVASAAASLDYSLDAIEMVKVGEATNATVGGTNSVKGEILDTRALTHETGAADGKVTVVLTEDEITANGLITVAYDPEVLTYVDTLSDVELFSVNEKDGVICFAYASTEEIEAGTALATLNFTYEGEEIDTKITVNTLERYDDVAVEEDALVIPVKVEIPVEPKTFNLVDVVSDGDEIVIYNPLSGMAVSNADLSAEYPNYRAGVAVTPEDDKIVTNNKAIVWTVKVVDGGVQLLDAEGHKLSMDKSGLELDKANDVWEIRNIEGEGMTCNIVNVNAAPGNSGDPKALEWYTKFSEFSTHYLNATDGQFIFQIYDVNVAEPQHDCKISHFTDVMEAYPDPESAEHKAIEWAFTHEPQITSGMNATTFGVGKTLTRAQAAAFLYAAAGKPEFDETTATVSFTDVPAGKWYTKPVLWAASTGAVSGYADGTFKPNGTLTRGQVMTLLYAYAGKPAVTIDNPYSDVAAGKWYTTPAIWGYEAGLERGEDGKFAQSTPCTRDAFVLYLYRYMTHDALLGD